LLKTDQAEIEIEETGNKNHNPRKGPESFRGYFESDEPGETYFDSTYRDESYHIECSRNPGLPKALFGETIGRGCN
jgi:hypothetical protein